MIRPQKTGKTFGNLFMLPNISTNSPLSSFRRRPESSPDAGGSNLLDPGLRRGDGVVLHINYFHGLVLDFSSSEVQ